MHNRGLLYITVELKVVNYVFQALRGGEGETEGVL